MGNGEAFVYIFPIIFGVLVIGMLIYGVYANKKHREAAQAFAAERGWTYTPRVPGLTSRWRSDPFNNGHSRRATNVLTGDFHGCHVVSMDYQYTTGSGKNSTTHRYHVVALSLPVPLPWLQLTPEGFGAGVAKFFGGQDIQFESKAFNDAWRVRGPEGQYAFDFIHPRMMDRLMEPDALGRQITVEGTDIFLAASGKQVLQAVDYYVNLLYGIEQLIPRHLWLKVGHDPLQAGGA
ncbi:hypothetical protein [Pseudactinotalea sp.]|uniref:hypothetical protein n=1 Tax=Pseudactinotalea sp. TaxID=1926260 RepID=UPI003B3BC650